MRYVYNDEILSNHPRKDDGHRDTSQDKHDTRDPAVIASRDITVAPLYLDARNDVMEVNMIVSL